MAASGGRMDQQPDGVRTLGNQLGQTAAHGTTAQNAAKSAAAGLSACATALPGCAELIRANKAAAEKLAVFAEEVASGLTAYDGIAQTTAADYAASDQVGRQAIIKSLRFDEQDLGAVPPTASGPGA